MDQQLAKNLDSLSTAQALALAQAAIDHPGGAELGCGTALLFFPLAVRKLERIADGKK